MSKISEEAVVFAFDKVHAFSAVHRNSSVEDMQEAFDLLLSSVGVVDEEARDAIYAKVGERASVLGPGAVIVLGYMLIGIVAGLAMAEYEREFA